MKIQRYEYSGSGDGVFPGEKFDIELIPQPRQKTFLNFNADPIVDIVIYGGAFFGGKTWALEMSAILPTSKLDNPKYGAVIFRRTMTEITMEGGLWDESQNIYPYFGGDPVRSPSYQWRFPSGAKITFAHLQYEQTAERWLGGQSAFYGFDQLESFTSKQFFGIVSRNRSGSGIRPIVRANCNPKPRSWLKNFLQWWIDEETGLAIEERSGAVRWMLNIGSNIHWFDTEQEAKDFGINEVGMKEDEARPMSVAFVPATMDDNQIGLQKDPTYKAKIMGLPEVERIRNRYGNWNIDEAVHGILKRSWFQHYGAPPAHSFGIYQSWDTAQKTAKKNDYSVCTTWMAGGDGTMYLLDVWRGRAEYPELKQVFRQLHKKWNPEATLIEDANHGTALLQDDLDLPNCSRIGITPKGTKEQRMSRVSVLYEAGRIKHPDDADWLTEYEDELATFPMSVIHDDQVDSTTQFLDWIRNRDIKWEPMSTGEREATAVTRQRASQESSGDWGEANSVDNVSGWGVIRSGRSRDYY